MRNARSPPNEVRRVVQVHAVQGGHRVPVATHGGSVGSNSHYRGSPTNSQGGGSVGGPTLLQSHGHQPSPSNAAALKVGGGSQSMGGNREVHKRMVDSISQHQHASTAAHQDYQHQQPRPSAREGPSQPSANGATTPVLVHRHRSPQGSPLRTGAGPSRSPLDILATLKSKFPQTGNALNGPSPRPTTDAAPPQMQPTPRSSLNTSSGIAATHGQAPPHSRQGSATISSASMANSMVMLRETSPRPPPRTASSATVGSGPVFRSTSELSRPDHMYRYVSGSGGALGGTGPNNSDTVVVTRKVLGSGSNMQEWSWPEDYSQSEISTGYADTQVHGAPISERGSNGQSPKVRCAPRLVGASSGQKDLGALRAELDKLRQQALTKQDIKAAAVAKCQAATAPLTNSAIQGIQSVGTSGAPSQAGKAVEAALAMCDSSEGKLSAATAAVPITSGGASASTTTTHMTSNNPHSNPNPNNNNNSNTRNDCDSSSSSTAVAGGSGENKSNGNSNSNSNSNSNNPTLPNDASSTVSESQSAATARARPLGSPLLSLERTPVLAGPSAAASLAKGSCGSSVATSVNNNGSSNGNNNSSSNNKDDSSNSGAGGKSAALVNLDMLHAKLEEISRACQEDHVGRDILMNAVKHLESRLNEGLASIGEVAQARMATDNATDSMLNALRRCIDELSEQCAWPADHVFQGAPLSLAQAVLGHDAELKELVMAQSLIIDQQHRQYEKMEEMMTQQQRLAADTNAAVAQTTARQAKDGELASKLEALSKQMLENEERNNKRVAALEAALRDSKSSIGEDQLLETIKQVEAQFRAHKADKEQVSVALKALQEQVTAAAEAGQCTRKVSEELKAAVQQLETQVQSVQGLPDSFDLLKKEHGEELLKLDHKLSATVSATEVQEARDEVAAVAEAVNMLFERVNELAQTQENKPKFEKELAGISSFLRKIAARVESLELQMTPARSNEGPSVSSTGTHNQRRQSSVVLSQFGIGDSTRSEATTEPLRSPKAASSHDNDKEVSQPRAPSPRNWLSEPLSAALARSDGKPTSLQQAPSMASTDILTRSRN